MQTLRRTPLHDRHVALGARMVPFAGWEMPVQYEGVIQEHKAVRTAAGAFDVSHMGEIDVEGPQAHAFLQSVRANDRDRRAPVEALYTLLTNERGCMVDDLIAYRLGEFHDFLVVNAIVAKTHQIAPEIAGASSFALSFLGMIIVSLATSAPALSPVPTPA